MGGLLIHIIPSILSGFLLQLILHELGHCVFGLITGWQFLYVQIHRLVLSSADGKLSIIVVKDKGYRCIMYPKSIHFDALLYTMGGCIINLLTAIIGLSIMVTLRMSPMIWLYTWSISAF